MYTALKIISFRITEGAKNQDQVDGLNVSVVDLENLGEDLSDEQIAIQ